MAGIDANTLLLLNGETLTDTSQYNVPITNNGVQISTAQAKFGNSSMYFDGKSNLLISMPALGLNFNEDWTLEWWEYTPINPGTTSAVFCMPNRANGFVSYSPSSNSVRLFAGNNAWDFIPVTTIGTFIASSWTHRAICKTGTTIYAFQNGRLFDTITTSGTLTSTENLYIGYRATSSNAGYFKGYLDEIRVSNIARWTSNFTPPTEPYSISSNMYVKIDNVWQPVTGIYTKTNNTW